VCAGEIKQFGLKTVVDTRCNGLAALSGLNVAVVVRGC
jgi:hypothetical protein